MSAEVIIHTNAIGRGCQVRGHVEDETGGEGVVKKVLLLPTKRDF